MDIKGVTKYKCNVCNKYYKSYKCLWNHNSLFHDNAIKDETKNKLKCDYCDRVFAHASSKSRHQKQCKIEYEQNEINKLKQDIKELKTQPLLNNSNNTNINGNSNIIGNNNITNNTVIQLVTFGKEDIKDIFTLQEQREILKYKCNAIDKLIEKIHFNDKLPQWKNIVITNLKDNLAYKYDGKYNKFIACDRNEELSNLIDGRLYNLEEFLENNEDVLSDAFKTRMREILYEIGGDTELRRIKMRDLTLIIYNNSDGIPTIKK
jgi:hypothetical protein